MEFCRSVPTRFIAVLARLSCDRRGAVAIEYGLLAAMIAVALIGIVSMSGIADNQSETYNRLSDAMKP
jgi:Flp pilus assembly pilin Flp